MKLLVVPRILWVVILVSVLLTLHAAGLPAATSSPKELPEFTHTDVRAWLNSPPLTTQDLHGKVLLLDVWTFDCWNCYRSFPWLKAVEKKFSQHGLQIIGVHTPEFDHEKVASSVAQKALEFGLHHPIMLDNNFSYWRALGNRYWPTFYLVDKQGIIRRVFIGETHINDKNARAMEKLIQDLLREQDQLISKS